MGGRAKLPRVHGSLRGFSQHRYDKTIPCPECLAAYKASPSGASTGQPKGRMKLPREHGTLRGVNQHRKYLDFPICEPCTQAWRTERQRRAAEKRLIKAATERAAAALQLRHADEFRRMVDLEVRIAKEEG